MLSRCKGIRRLNKQDGRHVLLHPNRTHSLFSKKQIARAAHCFFLMSKKTKLHFFFYFYFLLFKTFITVITKN